CAEKHTSWLKFEKSWQYTFLNKISDLFLGEKNTSNILNKQLIHNIERLQELELKIDQRFFSRNVRTMMAYVFFPIVVDWLVTGYLDKVRLKEQAPSDPQLTSFKAFQDNINELDKQGILPMLPVILPVAGISALLLKKISDCKKDFLRFYEGSFQYYLDGGKNSSVVCNKKYSLYRSRMMLLRGLNQKAADSLQKKWKDFCSHEKSTLTKKMEFCQEYLEPQILLELISICCKTFANNEAAKSFCDMITMIGEILQRSLQSRTDQAGLKYTDLWQHKFLMEILKLFNDKKITSKFLDSELSANIKWLYEYNAVKKAKMISAWRRWQLSRIILPILIEYTVIGCLSEGKIEVETANACQLDSLAIFKDNVKKLQTKEMLKNSEIVMREAGANEVEEASVADVRLPVPTPVVPMLDTALLAQTLPPSSTPAKLSLLRSFQFFQETLPRRDGGAHKRPFTEMSDNEKPPTKQRYPYETFLESPRQPSPDVETVADQSEEFNKHHRPWEL
ncbi:MAG TPA: hypothetical protein VHZ76_08105, partial [Gammaproteobacteria bacterium]|nr:hypothetical protein [Gammaproteobacteria bacterium]